MTKDEIKNKISMALKDPILQQGFECICKENAELRKIAEFQQSSNMETHFENKRLKEVLAVGSTWNKGLNSRNKYLEEKNDKYRNMVFDKMEQLDKAKELLTRFVMASVYFNGKETDLIKETEQFLKECE